jgi:DNA-binding transcriptional MerR regulator
MDGAIERPRELASSFLFIGELAKQTGTDPKTIRFYERADLLSPPRHGRFRTYLASDVQRLKNVLTLRRIGLPIALIRELLAEAGDGGDILASPRAAATLRGHLAALLERQKELADQVAQTTRAIDRLAG